MMVTENIDIVIRERGARTVRRSLEDLGRSAHETARGFQLLHSSLLLIIGGRLLAGLGRMLDEVTNFRNRLAILNVTGAEAAAVQKELFDAASRTRTTFAATSQVFTRTALATKSLGISMRETIQFTESLQQAAVLSGASVRETNASLIQLSQALASNRFSGDEFKAVAEQLPFVLDIIAMELTRVGNGAVVAREDIRQLGIDGKLTAELILRSFRNARDFLAEAFAKTIPTLEQAFVVFTLEMQRTFSQINETIKGTEILARAIVFLSLNLEKAVAGILAFGAAFATIKIANHISAANELRAAVASGNAVLLTSVEIERAKAATSLISAQTTASSIASKIREMQVNIAALQQERALIILQQQSIVIDNQKRIAKDALTGRFIAYDAALRQNIRTNVLLSQTERALTAARAGLATATASMIGAENTLIGAQTRSAAAAVATDKWTAKLARAFPGITAAASTASAALLFFGKAALANPYTAIAAAIVATGVALAFLSDKIKVTEDKVVTLRDVFVASFQLLGEAITPVTNFLAKGFTSAVDGIKSLLMDLVHFVGSAFSILLNTIKGTINLIIGLFIGLSNTIERTFNNLSAILEDVGKLAVNGLMDIVEERINRVIRIINSLLNVLKVAGKENLFGNIKEVDFSEFNLQVGVAGQAAGDIFTSEFRKALSTDFVGDAITSVADSLTSGIDAIVARARLIAEKRIADLDKTSDALKRTDEEFQKVLADLRKENELLGFNSQERERLTKILQIEGSLKRVLSDSETKLVDGLLKQNQVLERAADLYDEILDPMLDYKLTLEAINELVSNPKIRLSEVKALELRSKAWLKYLDTQEDVNSGIERGLLKITKGTKDAASEIENALTSAYNEVRSPAQQYNTTLKALNILLKEGIFNQREFSEALARTRIAFLDAQTDMASGIERGFLKILQKTGDFASQIEDIMTNAFDGVASAIADLVVDGEADFKSLARSIERMFVQLALSSGFQAVFGGGGAGAAGTGATAAGGAALIASLTGGAGGGAVGLLGGLSAGLAGLSVLKGASLTAGSTFLTSGASSIARLLGGDLGTQFTVGNAANSLSSPLASIGSFASNIALNQLLGNRGIGSTIGSLIGGSAGSFFGPAGSVAGSAAGNIIGGLFGNKSSVGPNAGGQLRFAGESFAVGPTGADNGGSTAPIIAVLETAANALNTLTALPRLGVDASKAQSGPLAQFIDSFGFAGINGSDDLIRAVINKGMITGLTELEKTMLLGSSNIGEAIETLVSSIGSGTDSTGLLAALRFAILEFTDPKGAAVQTLEAQQAALRTQLSAVGVLNGVVLSQVEQLEGLQLAAVLERFTDNVSAANDNFKRSSDQITGFLNRQTASVSSPLPIGEALAAARGQFASLVEQANAGGAALAAELTPEILDAAGRFNDLNRQVNASSVEFFNGFNAMNATLRGLNLTLSTGTEAAQTEMLVQGAEQISELRAIKNELSAIRIENAQLRAQSTRIADARLVAQPTVIVDDPTPYQDFGIG